MQKSAPSYRSSMESFPQSDKGLSRWSRSRSGRGEQSTIRVELGLVYPSVSGLISHGHNTKQSPQMCQDSLCLRERRSKIVGVGRLGRVSRELVQFLDFSSAPGLRPGRRDLQDAGQYLVDPQGLRESI